MTLEQAKQLTERKFVKPADDKCFDAKIYDLGEFKPHELIEPNYPTLVSDIVKFDLEYRCFVNDGRIKTWSSYIIFDEIANPKFWEMVPGNLDSLDYFVESLLHDLYIDGIETFPSVIDIGRIAGKGWAVIETNPAWASGLYGCDPTAALKVMAEVCEKIF